MTRLFEWQSHCVWEWTFAYHMHVAMAPKSMHEDVMLSSVSLHPEFQKICKTWGHQWRNLSSLCVCPGASYKWAYWSLTQRRQTPRRHYSHPMQNGKALTWGVTVATPLADSHISASATSAGAAVELAAMRKITKYCNLPAAYMYQPIASETLGAINSSAGEFLANLSQKISGVSGEIREGLFLFQRLSIVLQQYNEFLQREFLWGWWIEQVVIPADFINLLCLISPHLGTK